MEPTLKPPNITRVSQFLDTKTKGAFSSFLVDYDICSECLSPLRRLHDEIVCTHCGRVYPATGRPENPWIGDSHKPVNELAFGRGLGGTLQLKGLWCVLAKGNGNEDLPLRARQISVITRKLDHPVIARMLQVGSILLHTYGFGEHSDKKNIRFSNTYGRLMRLVGAYYALANLKTPVTRLAKACFLATFHQLKTGVPENIENDLNIPVKLVAQTLLVYNLTNLKRK